MINNDILQNKRADYGKQVIDELSKELTRLYGEGFSKRNLRNFIRINDVIPEIEIMHSLSAQLSWTHLRTIIFIEDDIKREFYIQMCKYERWSVRTLKQKIDSMLFERTAISKKPEQTITNDLKKLEHEKKISPDLFASCCKRHCTRPIGRTVLHWRIWAGTRSSPASCYVAEHRCCKNNLKLILEIIKNISYLKSEEQLKKNNSIIGVDKK